MRISGAFEMRSLRVIAYPPTLINFICLSSLSLSFPTSSVPMFAEIYQGMLLPLSSLSYSWCNPTYFLNPTYSAKILFRNVYKPIPHIFIESKGLPLHLPGGQGIRKTYLIPCHSIRKTEGYTVMSKYLSPVGLYNFALDLPG